MCLVYQPDQHIAFSFDYKVNLTIIPPKIMFNVRSHYYLWNHEDVMEDAFEKWAYYQVKEIKAFCVECLLS